MALEAIRGDLTLAELAAKHGVHHTMIAAWKRQAIDGMSSTFAGTGDAARSASESVDSDDAAHLFRSDRAHHSELMPPGRECLIDGLVCH